MKTEIVGEVVIHESNPEPYPYPTWSPEEISTLERWYPVIGLRQCSELWIRLTGRGRTVEQIDNKARRLGIQSHIPDDWMELFDEEKDE